jgi:hypothetical protein
VPNAFDGMVAFHARVIELADKYDLPGLALVAQAHIDDFLAEYWSWWTGFDMQVEVESVFKPERKTAAYQYAESAIVTSFWKNRIKMAANAYNAEFTSVLEHNPRFACMLARKVFEIKD